MDMEKAAAIKSIIDGIAKKNGGTVTPDEVLAQAKNKKSPLHDCFEWDDSVAAEKFRLVQARILIRTIRVDFTNEVTTVSVQGYVRDPSQPSDEQGYISTAVLATDKDRCREALVAEFTRAAGCLRRAQEFAVAFDMVDDVTEIADKVETMRTTIRRDGVDLVRSDSKEVRIQ